MSLHWKGVKEFPLQKHIIGNIEYKPFKNATCEDNYVGFGNSTYTLVLRKFEIGESTWPRWKENNFHQKN